jgi:hypothetical protein
MSTACQRVLARAGTGMMSGLDLEPAGVVTANLSSSHDARRRGAIEASCRACVCRRVACMCLCLGGLQMLAFQSVRGHQSAACMPIP